MKSTRYVLVVVRKSLFSVFYILCDYTACVSAREIKMIPNVKIVTETDVARRSTVREFNYDVVVLAGCFLLIRTYLQTSERNTSDPSEEIIRIEREKQD